MSRGLSAFWFCVAGSIIAVAANGCGAGCGCPNDSEFPIPDVRGDSLAAVGPIYGPLTVVSFNIRLSSYKDDQNDWRFRKDLVCEVIRDSGAQVIGLQEACRDQLNYIRQKLPQFGEVGLTTENGSKRGEHTPILYDERRFDVVSRGTFWLSGRPDDVGSNTWWGMCPRVCSWANLVETSTGKSLWVYNAHFDHVWQRVRENSARLIAERIAETAGSDPVILTGDLNSGENSRAVRYIEGQSPLWRQLAPLPMKDSFRIAHPHSKNADTFHAFTGDGRGKLDYIFLAGDFQVISAHIITDNDSRKYPSDHFPVTATIEY